MDKRQIENQLQHGDELHQTDDGWELRLADGTRDGTVIRCVGLEGIAEAVEFANCDRC